MQVDPIKPTLKAPGTERLKLKCDEPLSNFAFKFNLRRYLQQLAVDNIYPDTGSRKRILRHLSMCDTDSHPDKVERCRLTLPNPR